MKRLTHTIVRMSIHDWEKIHSPEVRAQYGLLQGWVSIFVNLLLAVVKGFMGFASGSLALIADAFHTLSDILTSVVIVVSFHVSGKPSDKEHPFGHGRLEAIATLIVAVLLMVVGVEILKGGIDRMLHPAVVDVKGWMIVLVGGTVIAKELLSQFSKELSVMIGSSALEADFWHHRSDALSSLLVIVALVGQKFGVVLLDGFASLLVAAIILYTGWRIIQDGIDELLGRQPSSEWTEKIKNTAKGISGVVDVHDLIVHQYGQKTILSLHVQICDSLSLRQAHDISEQVEQRIENEFGAHATIHLDPVNLKDPELNQMIDALQVLVDSHDTEIKFHDLRVLDSSQGKGIAFDLKVDPVMEEGEINAYKRMLTSQLQKKFPDIQFVQIQIEPKYVI